MRAIRSKFAIPTGAQVTATPSSVPDNSWSDRSVGTRSVQSCPRRSRKSEEGRGAMSLIGTTRTFRNVRYSVAVGGKADIEQAAYKMLDL